MNDNNDQNTDARGLQGSDEAAARADAVAALEVAEARVRHLEAVLDTVPVGVLLADKDGRIFHGNALVEKMVRHPVYASTSVDTYDRWVSFHPDGTQVKGHEYPLARVLNDGVSESQLDVEYQKGDGDRFWMRIIGKPIFNKQGSRIGAAVAMIDIDNERQLQRSQEVLIGELDHRVKNAFSVVKSIVSLSLGSLGVDADVQKTINERLDAYAIAHSKLVGTQWDRSAIRDIVAEIVDRTAMDRISYDGPDIVIPSREAVALSMAIYELSTNALKHGSLSAPGGRVEVRWSVDDSTSPAQFSITWVELDGPSAVVPTKTGFGSFIIDSAVSMETSGAVVMDYHNEGFRWQLTAPIKEVT